MSVLALLSLCSLEAEATTMIQLSVDQLVDASDTIVKAQVVSIWTEIDPKTQMIWTHAQLDVSEVLKGSLNSEYIVIEQPGGAWGSKTATIESVARFSLEEEGYFFVEHLSADRSVPVGMFQGKYNILMDPYTQKEIVHRFPLHPSRAFDHRFIPLPPEEHRVSLESFEEKILSHIEEGWNGEPIPGTSNERLERINNRSSQPLNTFQQ